MNRYHAVFSTWGSGGYCEFSAVDDDHARDICASMSRTYGRLLSLSRNLPGPGDFRESIEVTR